MSRYRFPNRYVEKKRGENSPENICAVLRCTGLRLGAESRDAVQSPLHVVSVTPPHPGHHINININLCLFSRTHLSPTLPSPRPTFGCALPAVVFIAHIKEHPNPSEIIHLLLTWGKPGSQAARGERTPDVRPGRPSTPLPADIWLSTRLSVHRAGCHPLLDGVDALGKGGGGTCCKNGSIIWLCDW